MCAVSAIEEIRPRPEVVSYCARCKRSWYCEDERDAGIVSPTGVAHWQHWFTNEHTACGIDATGDQWWWRL